MTPPEQEKARRARRARLLGRLVLAGLGLLLLAYLVPLFAR
jgi:hypothetical protein